MKNSTRKKIAAIATASLAFGAIVPSVAMAETIAPEVIQDYNLETDAVMNAQFAKEKEMLKELRNGDYSLENPYVEVDPYGNAPLSAYVMFKSDEMTWASVLINAKDGSKYPEYCSIKQDFKEDLGKTHVLPIYGLYAGGIETTVTITLYDKKDNVIGTQDIKINADEDSSVKNSFGGGSYQGEGGLSFKAYKNYTAEYDADGVMHVVTEELDDDADKALKDVYMMDKYSGALTTFMMAGGSGNTVFGVDLDGEYRMIYSDFCGVPCPTRVDLIDADKAAETGLNATGHGTGHFLSTYDSSLIQQGQAVEGIIEYNPMGKFYKIWNVLGIHHEFIYNSANDSWITDTDMINRETTEDYFQEIDYKTGEVIRDWDAHDLLDLTEYTADSWKNYDTKDWAHINSMTIVRDKDGALEDAMVFSPRHKDGLYKVNLATSELEWYSSTPAPNGEDKFSEEMKEKALTPVITLGDGTVQTIEEWWKTNKDLNPNGDDLDWNDPRSAYFTNPDCPFEYTFGQHAVNYLPNGDIFVYDNGNARSKSADKSKHLTNGESYSRAVIYHIDEENGTIEQVWQYGKSAGELYYAPFICDVDYVGENHYIVDFGGAGAMGAVQVSNAQTNVVEIKDGEPIFTMHCDGSTSYRQERVHLYQVGEGEAKLGEIKGEVLGEALDSRPLLSDIELPDVINVAIDGDKKIVSPIITDNWNEYSASGYVGDNMYDYTHPETSIKWTSDGSSISIDGDGEITALETGGAVIKATLNGGYNTPSADCFINVVDQVANVKDGMVQPGDSVTIPVVIDGNDGVDGVQFTIQYDKNVFDAAIQEGDFATSSITYNDKNGKGAIVYNKTETSNGALFNIVLTAKDDANIGDYPVEVTFDSVAGGNIATNNGKVSVGAYALLGDVSGDGLTNNADVVLMARYLVGLENLSAKQIKACDMNGDGSTDIKDLVALSRSLVDLQ